MAHHNKKKSAGYTLLKIVFSLIIAYVIGVILNSLLVFHEVNVFSNPGVFTDSSSLTYGGIIVLLFSILWLSKSMENVGKTKIDDQDQYFNGRFVSDSELKKDKKFNNCEYSTLKTKADGIVIRSEKKAGKLHINFYKPIHTMIIGTTGSGKTTRYVDPTIQILAKTKTKPSLVISDPKGELYTKHAKMLIDEGYEVKVLDLRNPYSSTRWNPLHRAFLLYKRAHDLEDEIKVRKGVNPADLGLKITAHEYGREWYEFYGCAYATKAMLASDLMSKKQQLVGAAMEDLKDIALMICPVQSQSDPTWERGAQAFINGILVAMLEDTMDPKLEMDEDKFIFYNVNKIANLKDGGDDKLASIKEYFNGRDKFSTAPGLANTVINNSPKTADNYMGIATNALNLFNDQSMCYLTSSTDIDFETMTDNPTAFFIKIPDEKEARHPIATMAISQLYKTLVEVASRHGGELERDVHFILDEFGNLPKIENLNTIITVARGRKIFLHLIVQSYTQLNIKYGDSIADTLKSNCNIHIFIGTTDNKTKEDFSKLCGNRTIKTQQETENKSGKETNKSKSFSYNTRPLIYPDELEHLGKNTFVVKIFNEFPIKAVFTPAYECPKIFSMNPMPELYSPSKYLDESNVYYDIRERNEIILNNNSNNKGFFDDVNF